MTKPPKSNLLQFPRKPSPSPEASEYETLLAGLIAEHRPRNTVENALVEMMARQHTLMQRCLRLQQAAFVTGEIEKNLPTLMRQHSAAQRGFHQALSTLMKEKQRRLTE